MGIPTTIEAKACTRCGYKRRVRVQGANWNEICGACQAEDSATTAAFRAEDALNRARQLRAHQDARAKKFPECQVELLPED